MEQLKQTERLGSSFFSRCRDFIKLTLKPKKDWQKKPSNIDEEIQVIQPKKTTIIKAIETSTQTENQEKDLEDETVRSKRKAEEKWLQRRTRRQERVKQMTIKKENKERAQRKDFEALLDEYTSEEAIQKAIGEKTKSLAKKIAIPNAKKDYPKPQDSLDLHNYKGEEARRKTVNYLKNSQFNKLKTVRIITGKGIHSENAKAVVRGVVSETVIALKREGLVMDYEWENKTEQKSGAIIVYLATRRMEI